MYLRFPLKTLLGLTNTLNQSGDPKSTPEKIGKNQKAFICLFCFLSTFLLSEPSWSLDQDPGSWQGFFAQGSLHETSPWGYFLEAQQRVGKDQTVQNRILLRWAIRYQLQPGLFLYTGHAWTPNMAPFRDEHRLWQQVQSHFQWNHVSMVLRFRQEQRDIENTDGIAHRSRLLLRSLIPRSDSIFHWAFWNEYFYNLNTVPNGPEAGFDQNRLFIGPSFFLHSGKVLIEPGYMNVYSNRARRSEDLVFHLFTVYAFINF